MTSNKHMHSAAATITMYKTCNICVVNVNIHESRFKTYLIKHKDDAKAIETNTGNTYS